MAVGKKAVFFTLISVVVVVAMIAFFMPNYETYSYMSKVPTLKTRFVKANEFVSGLYGEVGTRIVTYSSYNALKALNDNIDSTNRPLKDAYTNFSEVVLNGTLNGAPIASMRNNTIPARMAQLNRLASEELGLKTNISVGRIEIYQSTETGFDKVGVNVNITIFVDAGFAKWNATKPVAAMINLEWVNDPYYIMNFNIENRMRFNNITNWTSAGVEDVYYHIDEMKYSFEPDAPSFLMRLENKTGNSSCCGMESLINSAKLMITSDRNVSYVDYCYFNTTLRQSCGYPNYMMHKFTHLTNTTVGERFYGFKLDPYHITKYNLTSDMSD